MIYCTIDEVQYQIANDSVFSIQEAIEARSILELTVLDPDGTADFQRGQPVYFTDSDTGKTYRGFVNASKPTRFGLATAFVGHDVTFFDKQYLLGKRTNSKNYAGWYAGPIAIDFAERLADEGVTVAAATHRDSTVADFNVGIASNVASVVDGDDGALELAKAGSDVTLIEDSITDFASGILTNVVASASGLVPTSSAAIQMIGTTGPNGGRGVYKIWVGSKTIASNDTFHYEMWVGNGSPSGEVAADFTCSDGTTLSSTSGVDGQGYTGSAINDLSGYASNQWYGRSISLSSLSGKSISFVSINLNATKQGTYTVYFRNIYLGSASGSPFFSTTATSIQQNPPVQALAGNFYSVSFAVVTTYGVATTGVLPAYVRYSPANSISAANVLRSSVFNWLNRLADTSSRVALRTSYDGGITFLPATLNTNLQGLLPGASVAGKTVILEETLIMGTDPTQSPQLVSTELDIVSAPIAPTRTDFTKTFSTSADWSSGTLTNAVVVTSPWALADHAITLNGFTRTWLDGVTTGQTAWVTGSGYVGPFNQAMKLMPNPTTIIDSKSQFGFAGNWQNFTAAVDLVEFSSSSVYMEAGFVYRTTYWDAQNNTFAYTATMTLNGGPPDYFVLAKGSNSSSPSGARIATPTNPISSGSNHRLKIVINGNNHQLYLDDIQYLNSTDSSFTATGGIGLRVYGVSAAGGYARFANFGVVSATSGTWLSPSMSLTGVGTYGTSTLVWRNEEPSPDAMVLVETSLDGGTTYQTATNGGQIAGLTAGQSLSGIALRVRITLTTQQVIALPAVSGLRITVSNQYASLTGTRSTVPMGNDTMVRSNSTGTWNNSFDSQSYTKVGTGTTNLTSNKALISNTTGNVFMKLGTRTGTDMEGTHRFSLSGSIAEGMVLRYVDVNNYYALSASTTSIDLIKVSSGVSTTLKSIVSTLTTGANYNMRFRVVGSGPVLLYGRIWADLTLEDQTVWDITVTG